MSAANHHDDVPEVGSCPEFGGDELVEAEGAGLAAGVDRLACCGEATLFAARATSLLSRGYAPATVTLRRPVQAISGNASIGTSWME